MSVLNLMQAASRREETRAILHPTCELATSENHYLFGLFEPRRLSGLKCPLERLRKRYGGQEAQQWKTKFGRSTSA